MKKRNLIITSLATIFVIIIFSFLICSSKNNAENETSSHTNEDNSTFNADEIQITITSTNITTETKEIKFTITNNSSQSFAYGKLFIFQKKEGDSWIDVGYQIEPSAYQEMAMFVKAGTTTPEEKITLLSTIDYEAGEYRIGVKQSEEKILYGYFTMAEAE